MYGSMFSAPTYLHAGEINSARPDMVCDSQCFWHEVVAFVEVVSCR